MIARFNLEPFRSAAFVRYFLASTLAAAALWIYEPSLEWTVLTQTGSAGAVGVMQTTLLIAVTVAVLPGGALCDRFGAKAIQVVSLGGLATGVGIVAVLANTGHLTFEAAVAMTLVVGLFDGLWGVSAWIILPLAVVPGILGSAIGLTSLTGGIGRLVGGPVGGGILQALGPVTFVPAAIGLALAAVVISTIAGLREPDGPHRFDHAPTGAAEPEHGPTVSPGFLAALRWMRSERVLLSILVLSLLSAGAISTYGSLLPAFTRDALGAGAATLGLLSGIGGLGSIAGSLSLEALGRRLRRGRLVVVGYLVSGLLVGALGLTRVLPIAMSIVVIITFLSICFSGTIQLLIYRLPPAVLRARVVALYTFTGYLVLPLATTTVTQLTDAVGVSAVLVGMAVVAVVAGGIVVLLERPIWRVDLNHDGQVIGIDRPEVARLEPRRAEPEQRSST